MLIDNSFDSSEECRICRKVETNWWQVITVEAGSHLKWTSLVTYPIFKVGELVSVFAIQLLPSLHQL